MPLSNLVIPTYTLRHRGEEITLHGLSFNDITSVLLRRREDVIEAWSEFERRTSDGSDLEAYQPFALHMLKAFPALVAEIIAISADEPEAVEQAAGLPGPVALEAILNIGRLTFEDVGTVQNFLRNLAEMFNGLNTLARTTNIETLQTSPGLADTRLTGT